MAARKTAAVVQKAAPWGRRPEAAGSAEVVTASMIRGPADRVQRMLLLLAIDVVDHGRMDLPTVEAFVAVAEERHFGAAAAGLPLVQSGVSAAVARLERELGARLLDRSPRSVALTEAG